MHSNRHTNILLFILYNRVVSHDFVKTIIIPLVKHKSRDTTKANNYRPIALFTVASKLFESILLEPLTPNLDTTDNQFELKNGHSTDHFIVPLVV